jgi:hypothetical protein
VARKKIIKPKFRLDPAHRKVLNNSVKQIANERAANETARRERIREELERAADRQVTDEHAEQTGRVVHGLRNILTLVANTYPEWDPDVQVNVGVRNEFGTAYRKVSAWTDFDKVVVNYPASRFVLNPDGTPTADARDSIREVLGLGYHEIGHNLYTIPFGNLNAPIVQQRAWNALEDQRMELAVVNASPDLAAYLTIVVLRNIVDSLSADPAATWLLVAGRLYLPKSLRAECRAAFAAKHGEDTADRVKSIVREYAEADSIEALTAAVGKFYALITETSEDVPGDGTGGDHEKFEDAGRERDTRDATVTPVSSDDWDDDDVEGEGAGEGTPSSDGEDGSTAGQSGEGEQQGGSTPGQSGQDGEDDESGDDGSAPGESGEGDVPGQSGGTSGKGSEGDDAPAGDGGSGASSGDSGTDPASPSDSIRRAAEQAIEDAINEADNGSRIDDALREINSASTGGSNLPCSTVSGVLDADEQQAAAALALDFERALEEASAYNSPVWHRHQDQGVVDALAYRTRRPGDTSFRRHKVGDTGRGLDIAVSILLDVSGSMGGQEHDLSVAALGVKTACYNLNIPCTVTTYSDSAELLFATDEAPRPVLVGIKGCTNVSGALRDTHSHRGECAQHLVLVLTDGSFGDDVEAFDEVDALRQNGTYVLGVALNTWTDGLENVGCNASYRISQPGELALHVEDYLAGVASGAA